MHLTYTIDPQSFAVQIFSSGNPNPIINQPDWPNGAAWSSSSEAALWAQLCIQAIVDRDAPYAPIGPGLEGEPKPLPINNL